MKNHKEEIIDNKLLMEFEKDIGVEIFEKEAEKKLLDIVNPELQYTREQQWIATVQDVVNKVYPHIANNLGPSQYVDQPPTVELWKDIYARLSGIEGMEGEESATSEAEYESESNTIYIYYPNMKDVEDIIRSLLHEYTHSLQDPDERKGHREKGYEKDPDEIAASKAELNWEDYLVYLPHNLNESAPLPGASSVEGFDDTNLPYDTEYMNLDEILTELKHMAYSESVMKDLKNGPNEDGEYEWEVTNTVMRYADYWMEHPESLNSPEFPPIQVIGDGVKDGSHRIATLNALANHIDPDNPYWKTVELEVRVYDPKIVMDSGHFYPWLYDIPEDKLQDVIDNQSVYNWETLKTWKEEQPIQEQSADSPGDHISDDKEGPQLDETPFTPLDINILNRLATMFERAVLNNIWKEDESMLPDSVYSKYENIMKLYGEKGKEQWSFAKSTRFAKWADDNWDEAERSKEIGLGDDFDPTITYNLDFGLVTNPIKNWPHEYEVDATESYWAQENRYGSTIIPAYGEQNAEYRADTAWWEWDVDMEYGEQGDTDDHELEVDSVQYHSTIKEAQEDRETGKDLESNLTPEDGYEEHSNFTPNEVGILNALVKRFDKAEIESIATTDMGELTSDLYDKFKDFMKLVGENVVYGDGENSFMLAARYPRWALDNWNEARRNVDDSDIDFSRVGSAIKKYPSMYVVSGEERGWEQMTKQGDIDIAAWDREDAEERSYNSWWDYEPDMETIDWGDWEQDDFDIYDVQHSEILREEILKDTDPNNISPDLEIGDRIMVWDLTGDPEPTGSPETWDDVKMPRTLIGTVIDSLDDDEITNLSFRGGIKYMVRDDSTGEEYGLYRGADGYSEPYLDRDKWIKLPSKKLNENKKILGNGMMSPRAFNTYCKKFKVNESDKDSLKTKLTEAGIIFTKNWWEHYNEKQIKA